MKLKGAWSELTTYDVGDVVLYNQDDMVYWLQKPCAAGITPVDPLYWGRVSDSTAEMVHLISDAVGILEGEIAEVEARIPTNIDSESIVLASGDNEYLITVDASGETPEVVAELIVEEEAAAEGGD